MAVSSEHRPLDGSLPHELTSTTPFPSLKLCVLIGILSLSALCIALLIYLSVHPSRTSKKRNTLAKETISQASSGPSYEVFLSFRGLDTRHGFTDCLYHDMVDAGILVFRDDESLRVGKRIGDELLQAIQNSKIYIPIFSKNYVASHWCLRELAYMVECTSKSNENKEILPIFLDVEPDDVKLKTNLYSQALLKHQKKFCTEVVESWKKALIEVGMIKGWNWKKDEGQGDLIRSIIRTVSFKLKVPYENVTEHLVGVDDRVEAIIKMLDVESDGVRFLGIYGMGGVGKSTLAKVVFNQLFASFHQCCFLADVRESSQGNGLVNLQKQLLSELLGRHSIDQIHHVNDGINMMNKGVLRNRKVLIVLDDVDEQEQLKSLAKEGDWFGTGSRIIITSRNQSVLVVEGEATGEGPANTSIYEVQDMEFDHALKLFSRHAFRRDSPPDNRVSLSKKIVDTLGKLPLGLEIIGSSLIGKSEALWVDTWKKLQEAPPKDVQRKLMITYERLDHKQREVFLDIACFFVKEDTTYPFYMWNDCKYCPHEAIEVLILMSLIKIKDDNTFWMHDQVRDLGRDIVCQENREEPCERSRVWNPEETWSILKGKEGSRKIKALSLRSRGGILTDDEFANLPKLRFFHGNHVSLVGDFNNVLANLRWLSCHHCPSNFEAENFHPTNLIVLDLSYSEISEERIGWIRVARKLKVLDLNNCINLTRTPDLSTLVSLERLNLEGCWRLIEINPSIGELKHLTALNLSGCSSLRELPEEIGCLQALTEIVLPNGLHELPETIGNLKSLLTFDISRQSISKLPHSIGGMVKLAVLRLRDCKEIKELPDAVWELQSLIELDLSRTGISHLPDSIGNLKQLTILRMGDIEGITKLPSAIWLLEKLVVLDANLCWNLTGEIPEEIGRLCCLRVLGLSWTQISGLPTTMSRLSNLQELELDPCPKLRHLPDLPPSLTCLTWGNGSKQESVTALPTSIGTLSQLKKLKWGSAMVVLLPQLPSSLIELRLHDLATTKSLDFSNLKNLSILDFYNCWMPKFSGRFNAELEELCMHDCTFTRLDALFQLEMKRLTFLWLYRCEFLLEVLDLSHMKNLQEVDLCECKWLVEICGLEELGSLSSLRVWKCFWIERMSNLSTLRKLRSFRVGKCPQLRSVEGLDHLESLKYLWIRDCESLKSLPETSNLDLECLKIVRWEELPDRRNYCKRGSMCNCRWSSEWLEKSRPMAVWPAI